MTKCKKKHKPYMQNRELSWLKFNARVLEEASDESVPLLERLKFVSIFTSNLDEFFMIRVGSLFDMAAVDPEHCDNKSGLCASEQLDAIYEAVRPLYEKKTQVYQEIKQGLAPHGIFPLDFAELKKSEMKYLRDYYKLNVEPILAPQIVDTHHPFPHIANKQIYIMALLRAKRGEILGLLPLPPSLPEIVFLPGSDLRYIRMEKLLYTYADAAFGQYEVLEKNCLCITRNADINPDDEAFEMAEDFKSRMKKLLHKRKRLAVVRLEANFPLGENFCRLLCERFEITQREIFYSDTALKMQYVFTVFLRLSQVQRAHLAYPSFRPAPAACIDAGQSILRQIKQKDALISYPYESMDGFLQLIREAAMDPAVISIKMTIYRLANKSKLVEHLCAAAENGKEVTVLIELRARFDEQNNIDWSERLEDAGCRIIYGFDAYKVHSKLCLITMKEKSGVSYITQVGTGNYNEKTSELYTDLSLLTANHAIGRDAVEFFKSMAIGNTEAEYGQLLVAPNQLKAPLLRCIEQEIAKGSEGRVLMKMNSLTDVDFIEKLAEASRAGVRVCLIIRGICCILPQVPEHTENIRVYSVVGRFLEHSRIYSFGKGAEQHIYLASADLMTRNTERRVEVACPVLDPAIRAQINALLDCTCRDTVKSRVLQADGNYVKPQSSLPPFDSQETLLRAAQEQQRPQTEKRAGLLQRLRKRLARTRFK